MWPIVPTSTISQLIPICLILKILKLAFVFSLVYGMHEPCLVSMTNQSNEDYIKTEGLLKKMLAIRQPLLKFLWNMNRLIEAAVGDLHLHV